MTKQYRKPVTEVLYAQGPNLIKQLDDQSGVWSADVTYIRVPRGQYMDFGTVYDPENRKVLAHKLSSIRDGRFVSDILVEALKRPKCRPTYTLIWEVCIRVVYLKMDWRPIISVIHIPRRGTP